MSTSKPGTGWQPWQPENLLSGTAASPAKPVDESPCRDFLQAELANKQQAAEQQGFVEGLARGVEDGKSKGYQDGFSQGQKEGAEQAKAEGMQQQRVLADRLTQLLESFQQAMDSLDRVIPARLVQLSLSAAREVLGSQIVGNHQILLEKIQSLLLEDRLFNGPLQVRVNGDELAFIQEILGSTLAKRDWELLADSKILPGGCRITAQEGELDATITTRWQELCQLSREDYRA